MTTPNPDSVPLFRPAKKRKVYRQRNDTDNEDASKEILLAESKPVEQSLDEMIASSTPLAPASNDEDVTNISEILRKRKQRRIGGVEFRAEGRATFRDKDENALVQFGEKDAEDVKVESGMQRFAPQLGVVESAIDKHMMAYIENKLGNAKQGTRNLMNDGMNVAKTQTQMESAKKEIQRAPTTMGQLLEIDLGDDARKRNIERTEMARRRVQGQAIEENDGKEEDKKVKLGRDGKPRRGRKRRGSEDVQRDLMVEEILRENRLEIYEPPAPSSLPPNQDNPTANDDTLADLFRKDWEDAASVSQQQRQQQQNAAAKKKAGEKTAEEEYMKGPKLGGSRSARAAMREAMLAKKKKF